MTAAAFDAVAPAYDRIFTQSTIGILQRNQVWSVAREIFHPGDRILELGCGTGSDAVALSRLGASVVACDASPQMIAIAKQRAWEMGHSTHISFAVCANEDLHKIAVDGEFDGVFSNFASLNCSRDLKAVVAGLAGKVRPGGKLLLCLFGRFCLWEVAWFLSKGDAKKAFRRFCGSGASARVGGQEIQVCYPSVRRLKKIFSPEFSLTGWQGIGVTVPPSYAESFFHGRPRLLSLLARLDEKLRRMPGARAIGDHILLEFVRSAS
jgi:ubiquinone/menaquinone biosynthesis C-methylase UbiE